MGSLVLYLAAALAEIAGCFAVWSWLRLDRPVWWLVPGLAALALFAGLLAFSPAAQAGRAYAAYGGVYIGVALLWLWAVDQVRPSVWDCAGAAVALAGMAIIVFQPSR